MYFFRVLSIDCFCYMVCELICSYVPSSCGRCGLRAGFGHRWRGSRGGARGTPSSKGIARASTGKRSRVGGKRSSRKAHPGESRGAAGRSGGCGLHLVSLVERPIAGHERQRRPKETPRVRSGRRAARRSRRPGCAPPSRRLRRGGLAGVRSPGRDSQRETHGAGRSDRDAPVAGGVSMFQTERGGIDEAGSPG